MKEQEFTMYCIETLCKDVVVNTTDYTMEDGEIDTYDTEWQGVYEDNNHFTPSELISELKRLALSNLRKGYYDNDEEKRYLDMLIDESEDWISTDIIYNSDDY